MPWTEVTPQDLDSLFQLLRELVEEKTLCRGQSDIAWIELKSTLLRALEWEMTTEAGPSHVGRLRWELGTILMFRKHGYMHLSPSEVELASEVAGLLVLMQHYGGPTRLLDWTLSPWLAAYFAANDHADRDGLIWIISQPALVSKQADWENQFLAMLRAKNAEEWADAAFPETPSVCQVAAGLDNPRMNAQQSALTMAGSLCISQDVALEQMLATEDLTKVIIKSELKHGLLKQLHGMNINFYTLFGGLSGVAGNIKERVSRRIGVSFTASLRAQIESREHET